MMVDGPAARRSGLEGEIRLVIVESPDLAAPLVGALDAAEVGAWVWVEGEHCLYCSPQIPSMLGLSDTSGDLLARFLSAVHRDDREGVARLIGGGLPRDQFVLKFRYRPPEGEYRWLLVRGRVERDSRGALVRQGGTIRDVTTEVEQEIERAETTARLEALINALPFQVWGRIGPDLRLLHQNAASMQWWGDLRGSTVDDVPPQTARIWRGQFARALGGEILNERTTYERDGGPRIVDEIIAPVIVDGRSTGVVGVTIDITEQQRLRDFDALLSDIASDFVSRASDTLDGALVTALGRIGAFLHAELTCVCEIGPDAAGLRLLHWWIDPGSAATRPFAEEFDVSEAPAFVDRLRRNEIIIVNQAEDAAGLQVDAIKPSPPFRPFALVPARQSDGWQVVLGIAAPLQSVRPWSPETVPMLRLAGALLSAVIARQRAEAHRQETERRMQNAQKLESLGVLAGGIAHDFNNLLTAILGNASLLRAELSEVPAIEGPLEQIEGASRRAADLCRQMLAYAGRGRFALTRVSVNAMVRDCESLLRISVPKRAALEIHLAETLPDVLGDQAQLRQVLMNLMINAAEALADREGRIRIETSAAEQGAEALANTFVNPHLTPGLYVSIKVSDSGGGMDAETVSRIFEPFYSTKFTGRGLGLPAVAGIVRVHKGAIRVQSTPGAGAEFELLLPALPPVEGGDAPAAASDKTAIAQWRTSGKVIVVDDEPGVRDLARAVLQRLGMTVLTAEEGRAGIELFRAHAEDVRLVLVDLTMPGLDGHQVLAEMRKIREVVPAILMSGYTASDATLAGTQLFLPKPFTPDSLRSLVRRALAGAST